MKFYRFIWVPRIILMIYVLFLTIFSWDVFDMQGSIWRKLLALLIHNIPSLVFLLILWFSWKRPFWGGYIILALVAIIAAYAQVWDRIVWFLAMCGPLILVSMLFFLAHYIRSKPQKPVVDETYTQKSDDIIA